MNNGYTSFDLMKIFNISRGSWSSIKNKLKLNDYAIKSFEGKKEKFIYNEQAFKILNDYFKLKNSNNTDLQHLALIKLQAKEIEDLKILNSTFQNYYEKEKQEKEDLLILNSDLNNTINNLNLEIEKLKHRSFLDRLFNRF